jgi:di/tricarboxylate transporter
MLAEGLEARGVVAWFAGSVESGVAGLPMLPTVLLLALAYFDSMHGISMRTAHISAMSRAFLAACPAKGALALLAVPLFPYFSNLCGS